MMTQRIGLVLCVLFLVWCGYAVGRAMTPTAGLAPSVALDIADVHVESLRQSQLLLAIQANLFEIARRLPAPVSQEMQP
jgi:hypothetical protein